MLCDITKKKSLKKSIRKNFDYVVNLGGYVDHSNKKKTFDSHYTGCKNLAEIFIKKMPVAFLQMGSSIEYGKIKSPQKENARCNPKSIKSIYGKAKLLSSMYLINLFKKKNFPSTILRLYLAYGPRQDINRFIPIIIKNCIKNKKFNCSEGNQYRDFVHVDDVVNAILKSLINKNARGQIINVGSGKPRRIRNIIKHIKKILKGGYPQFGKIKLRKDEILKLYPNIKKAKNELNWKPKISFDQGLKSTIKFYNEA
jgi:nucleoside-diphosphate-sugar epimerase